MGFLTSFLANKIAVLVTAGLAILGAILIPVTISQALAIHGWPIFGGGLKNQVVDLNKQINEPVTGLLAQLKGSRHNGDVLEAGLGKCNASVNGYKTAADDKQKKLDEAIAMAAQRGAELRALSARISAFKPSGVSCEALAGLYDEVLK